MRRVSSPDGKTEFLLFVSYPGSASLPQLAYQVRRDGRLAVDTSFLGFDIFNQQPMLGENDGLTSSRSGEEKNYRWLVADYMQNGSLGRKINVEVRVWDDAVAFRYAIPRSTPLDNLMIADELTEFAIVGKRQAASLTMPAAVEDGAGGWIGISEVPAPGFPRMSLVRGPDGVLEASLPPSAEYPAVAYQGHTPLTCPWRVLRFGKSREEALRAAPAEISEK